MSDVTLENFVKAAVLQAVGALETKYAEANDRHNRQINEAMSQIKIERDRLYALENRVGELEAHRDEDDEIERELPGWHISPQGDLMGHIITAYRHGASEAWQQVREMLARFRGDADKLDAALSGLLAVTQEAP